MPGKRIGAAATFLLALGASPSTSWAQSPPLSADNATVLLQKSLAATNLKSPSNQPFRLSATVKYKSDGPALTGTFEILFNPPDRYRMNLTVGKISETQILTSDKLYISRSSQKFSPEAWRIADFLWSPGAGLQTPPKVIVGRETTYPSVTVVDSCEEESDALRIRKACFNPAQEITTFTIQNQSGSRLTQDNVSLTDFVSVGAYRYPGRLTKKSVWDTIEATVDSFALQSPFDENIFMPPTGSIARDWCFSPQALTPAAPPTRVVSYAMYVYYILVSADGRVKKFSFVNDPTAFALSQARQALDSKRYPILTCFGKPVEYEMVVITNSY